MKISGISLNAAVLFWAYREYFKRYKAVSYVGDVDYSWRFYLHNKKIGNRLEKILKEICNEDNG